MEWNRKCPECRRTQTYVFYSAFYKAKKWNKVCKSCCRKGKGFSDEHRKKISDRKVGIKQTMDVRLNNSAAQKKRYLDPLARKKTSEAVKLALHRPDVRRNHMDAMAKNHFLGNTMDVGQVELLEKWNRLGFKFEPNYQLHTDDFLCYLDGYDKKSNVVLEYDGKYHHSIGQQERDLMRQQRIIDILNPNRFWRYDAVNRQWTDVVGGK
jgi:very-short-patch-repair endonuclease